VPEYRIHVNGSWQRVEVESDTPLLWVLRDELGLTGSKYGCGGGFCRACTVHVDGEARFSCRLAISEVGDGEVITIEGLTGERARILKEAWIREDVPQCGYCQPGQVMRAAALLSRKDAPSDEEIEAWMSTNLCRCGTYARIRRAVRRAAAESSPSDA